MSSKVKSSAAAGLVPKLRFPEFQTASAWQNKRLSEVLSPVVRERLKPAEPYTGLGLRSHGKGTFLKEKEDPAKNAMDVLFEVKRDDLIVNITFAWEGAIAIAGRSDDRALVSHRFPTYEFKKGKALPEFFRYRILEKQFVYNLGVISPGGAGRNRVMSKTDFLKLEVYLPNPDEQQKIADCMASADALIEAQGRKVEALKAHKKGLMQQLFPQEGETQPRLRFPEFDGAGQWEEKRLDMLATVQSGSTPSKANSKFWDGSIPWVSAKDMKRLFLEDSEDHISEAAVSNGARLVPKGTLMLLTRGMTLIKDVPICVASRDMSFNQDVKGLRPRTGVNGLFLAWLLLGNKERLLDLVNIAGHGTGKIDTDELNAFTLLVPRPPEQLRIADCLTSLYDLITAETRKLDTLKTHKKGLMQQLFPQVGED
jgi:type I restriction enzyme S subunit